MYAGELRERISVIAEQTTEDDLGGQSITWPEQFETWAKVKPMRGTEQLEAQQLQNKQMLLITLRYRSGVTTAMRVVWAGKTLNILAVANPDLHRKYLELVCEEGVV